MKKKPKYRNKKNIIDNIQFDSKHEADIYLQLKSLLNAKVISDLRLQVPFEVLPKQKEERAIKYIADFVYMQDGKTIVVDAKGFRTKDYIIKRKLFKYFYPEYTFVER